jgi:hypothetical protein
MIWLQDLQVKFFSVVRNGQEFVTCEKFSVVFVILALGLVHD